MKRHEILEIANESGVQAERQYNIINFAKRIAELEREAISDEWWSCYQSDLENGVKSLNEYEAKKFAITYPELAKFGSWLEARGQA